MRVILHTESNAEDNAMLQALYSRSSKSITDHLGKLAEVGSGKFMEQFYLGYGHASIADCGFVTLYFEGISMLAAKALEDDRLFNGQECSTRYIDFSTQEFVNPYPPKSVEHVYAGIVLSRCRDFYIENLEPVRAHLRTQFPNGAGISETVYQKAINAKAFDVLRGFLPAGATTNVAWTTSLRKAHERLVSMMHHPLEEVQTLATQAYTRLYKEYPHSFKKDYVELPERDLAAYLRAFEGDVVYNYRSLISHFYADQPCVVNNADLKIGFVNPVKVTVLGHPFDSLGTLPDRPVKEALPKHSLIGQSVLKMDLTLDFGSFRDLQRHRGGYCSNPLLDVSSGFHPWYYKNLPDVSKAQADALFKDISRASSAVLASSIDAETTGLREKKLTLQYITPMGVLVPVVLVYPVSQTVYVAELRSGKTVHPTLRPVAQDVAAFLIREGIPVNADMEASDWTPRRGTQDITLK